MSNLSSVSSSPLPLLQGAPLHHHHHLLLLLFPVWVLYLHTTAVTSVVKILANWYSSACHKDADQICTPQCPIWKKKYTQRSNIPTWGKTADGSKALLWLYMKVAVKENRLTKSQFSKHIRKVLLKPLFAFGWLRHVLAVLAEQSRHVLLIHFLPTYSYEVFTE